jgi:hypothetical protein
MWLIQHDDDPICSMPGRRGSVDAPRGSVSLWSTCGLEEVGFSRSCRNERGRCVRHEEDIAASRKSATTGKWESWRLRYRKAERPYKTSCRRAGETAVGPAGDRQCGWVEFEYRRSCEMCLTVEWDLLNTASTEEEFDGSWR